MAIFIASPFSTHSLRSIDALTRSRLTPDTLRLPVFCSKSCLARRGVTVMTSDLIVSEMNKVFSLVELVSEVLQFADCSGQVVAVQGFDLAFVSVEVVVGADPVEAVKHSVEFYDGG